VTLDEIENLIDAASKADAAFAKAARELIKALRVLDWIANQGIADSGKWSEAVLKSRAYLDELCEIE